MLQDYYYVRGFTPFAGSLLASAPDAHLEVIVSGIAALTDELAWFKETARKRGLDLPSISERAVDSGQQTDRQVTARMAYGMCVAHSTSDSS